MEKGSQMITNCRHLSLFLALALLIVPVAGAMTFHVSPTGNDAWSGRLGEPNADKSDGPLATVVGARDAVRKLKAQGPLTEPVDVVIQTGVYTQADTLAFTAEDSGTEQFPVTYSAAQGAKPIISGGRAITGWTKGEGSLWTSQIPDAASGAWYFHQLFVNGRRAVRARTPNNDYLHIAGPIDPLTDREKARQDPAAKSGFRFTAGDVKKWDGWEDANVWLYHSWTSSLHWIKEIDEAGGILRFVAGSGWPVGYWDAHARYFVDNLREALDMPGEWFAAQGKCAEYINFRGLSFQHADWILDPAAVNDGQGAAFQSDASIMLQGARNIGFEQCEVAHVGTYAMWFRTGTKDCRMMQCEVHDLGTGALRIGETGDAKTPADAVEGMLVENCWLHDGGHVFPAGHGVWIGKSSYNRVRHCEVADFYYSAFAIGWSWGYAPSSAHHNVVEYCHIHDLGKGQLSDMGAIYTLGISPGTRLTNNVIHDIYSYDYGGWGLYNDEGSTHVLLQDNIVYNTKTGGYHQHYGKENEVRNNIFAFSKQGNIIRSREEEHTSFLFEGNIVLVDNGTVLGSNWNNDKFRMNNNVYWDVNGNELKFSKWTFDEWKAKGHDEFSLVADPFFVDAKNFDFRLKPDSPAFRLGFKEIDTSKVGLYGPPEWTEPPKNVKREPVLLHE